jgi:hypothetical protein
MGSRVRLLEGKLSRVCARCAPDLPAGSRSKKAKNPPRNDGFTTGKYGTPLGTKDYLGWDYRYQAGPKEQMHIKAHGSFMEEWRTLRGDKK